MEIKINSKKRCEIIDITEKIRNLIEKKFNETNKACFLYTGHTTCALLIQENFDDDVKEDILNFLKEKVPKLGHKHLEGNSDAHIKASLIGNSIIVPVINKGLKLGKWQGIFLCEFDGPRERTVKITSLN